MSPFNQYTVTVLYIWVGRLQLFAKLFEESVYVIHLHQQETSLSRVKRRYPRIIMNHIN